MLGEKKVSGIILLLTNLYTIMNLYLYLAEEHPVSGLCKQTILSHGGKFFGDAFPMNFLLPLLI